MILYKPLLQIRRLVVTRNEKPVYDERFHPGVNIIRGENGSGKTTIADFIAFALGGDVHKWRNEALLCDYVYAEILANDAIITLRRNVAIEPRRPMSIFWGPYEDAVRNPEAWQTYSYAQHGTKQSFSTVLFRALGIPEVRGQLASRITMHQLLRLMYVDQFTSVELMFEFEQFDSPLIRDAVGWLLCGTYDGEYYDTEMKLRELTSERDNVNGQIRSIYNVLGGRDISLADLNNRIKDANDTRQYCYQQLEQLRIRNIRLSAAAADDSKNRAIQTVAAELRAESEAVLRLSKDLENLELEIADSELFLTALRDHLGALDDSAVVRQLLGETSFELCPACYTPVQQPEDRGLCPLCKSVKNNQGSEAQLLRLKQEMAQQIAESESLQKDRLAKFARITADLSNVNSRRSALQARHRDLAVSTSMDTDPAQAELYRKIGYVEREVEELQNKLQLAQSVDSLERTSERLSKEIDLLEQRKERLETERIRRQFEARNAIVKITGDLLKKDLEREQTFRNAQRIDFDFAQNVVLVDGRTNFAASSTVYLKNCFHFAILVASLQHQFFRYPRFLLLDNVEDKGMEPARSHNFQRIVLDISREAKVEHQIIYTTSMIAPEMDIPELTVGERHTHDRKSLRIE